MNSVFAWTLPFCVTVAILAISDTNVTQFDGCSCDMTQNSCDVFCCCDQDCQDHQKESFSCEDNKSKRNTDPRYCNSHVSFQPDEFHSILCIEKQNNPMIGLFHPNIPAVNNIPSVNDLLKNKPLVDRGIQKNNGLVSVSGYVYGKELVVVTKNLKTSSLYIPYKLFSSSCEGLFPIRYLKDISSTCLWNVSNQCTSKYFNIKTFLLGSKNKQLLSDIDNEILLKDVKIHYFNPEEPCCYIKTSECSKYGCKRNKLKPILRAHVESERYQDLCTNVLLEVRYLFRWSGNRIISVDVNVVVDDIPLNSVLSQHFSVMYQHAPNTSQEIGYVGHRFPLGTIGYQIGDEVVALTNGTEIVETSLNLWKSDADGFCIEDPKTLFFGIERLSGCFLRITEQENTDCTEIRTRVLTMQSQMLSADFISRSKRYVNDDAVPILEESTVYNNTADDNPEICHNIPDHVVLELLYSEVFRTSDGPVYKIIAAIKTYSSSSWSLQKVAKSSGHLIWSSVTFRFVSLDDQQLLKTTKRSHLPIKKPWEYPEHSYWWDMLYPFVSLDFTSTNYNLGLILNSVCLLAILIVSVIYIFKMTTNRSMRVNT